MKRIALFVDGTWNSPTDLTDTNVLKLFDDAEDHGGQHQVTFYMSGVGTESSLRNIRQAFFETAALERGLDYLPRWTRNLLGGAFGWGTSFNIKAAYAFLCANYEQDDHVFLFGFSRGAFAVRSLAGFLGQVGILYADRLDLVETAYRQYESPNDKDREALKKYVCDLAGRPGPFGTDDRFALSVHLIGCWDTVGALGIPRREADMPGHWTEFHQMHLPVNVTHARHALAIHELRRKFQPLLWQDCLPLQSLKQVWFAGAHADVGGGYPSTHLSDTALQWMASEAAALGLELGWTTKIRRRPATPGKVHHELRGWFIGCNATVRRQLTDLRKVASAVRFDEVHDTAIHRLANDAARQYRFWRPGVNDALSIADRASLQLILVVNIMNGPIESKACYASERLEPLDAETMAWIDRFTLLDLESAEERVNALFDLEGTPSYGSQEQIIRALALTAVLKNCDLSTRFISFVLELGDQLRNSDKAPDEQSRLREHLLLRLRDSEKAVNELSLRFGKRHLPFWEKLALTLHTSNSKVACHDAPHSI